MSGMMRRAMGQGLALLLVSAALALGVNALRPDPLPLVGDFTPRASQAPAPGQGPLVGLDEARTLHAAGRAVFVDARSAGDYRLGHIKGALNRPLDDFSGRSAQALAAVPKDAAVITYCDGERCELSHELAENLKMEGWKNVRVLVNGWTLWTRAGLPSE